jgi:hypothetical protein
MVMEIGAMERTAFDDLVEGLSAETVLKEGDVFPLEAVVTAVKKHQPHREKAFEDCAAATPDSQLLLLALDATAVAASLAIKALAHDERGAAGVREDLVDIWGRSQAARSLWFDAVVNGHQGGLRQSQETLIRLASEAIGVSKRLGCEAAQYIEFTSKIDGIVFAQ